MLDVQCRPCGLTLWFPEPTLSTLVTLPQFPQLREENLLNTLVVLTVEVWPLGTGRVSGVSTVAVTVTLVSGPDAAARWAPTHRSSECLGVLPPTWDVGSLRTCWPRPSLSEAQSDCGGGGRQAHGGLPSLNPGQASFPPPRRASEPVVVLTPRWGD